MSLLRAHRPTTLSRRRFTAYALAVTAGIGLSACGLGPSTAESGQSETLTVATWKGYGADLPWVAEEFKKQTGATVRFQYIDSLQNMLQLVEKSNGSIDVALPNLQYLKPGLDKGLFTPLDEAKLTNYKNIYPALSERAELRKDGQLYAIPWVWGNSGIFYNAGSISTPPTSWSALWAPANKGRVALFDDSTILAPIAGLYLGEDPDNPEMSKAGPALDSLARNAKLVFSSSDDLAKAVSNGSVTIGVTDAGTVGNLASSGIGDIRFVLPKEGGMGWVDNWSIVSKSSHKDLAYKWLNFMTSPEYLTRWADDPQYASPTPANSAAAAKLKPETLTRLQTDPSKLNSLHLQLPLPAERLQSWADAWQKAKAG